MKEKLIRKKKLLTGAGIVLILAVVILAVRLTVWHGDNDESGKTTAATTESASATAETDAQTSETTIKNSSSTPDPTTAPTSTTQTNPPERPDQLVVSFYKSYSTTEASNQYALWIEDSSGRVVRTIFVTSFTATGNELSGGVAGYTFREDALPTWVAKAVPRNLSEIQLDSISGATPLESGTREYRWDLRDETGNPVPDGEYTLQLEGTLYWSSGVVFSGRFTLGAGAVGDIGITTAYNSQEQQNRNMITGVQAFLIHK
ncbi:DUF2271 domain-containing protein [Parasporobacterium paucivorans]|nr:DUF2271 domain-containing protein [Parasporobacterium paucivorans]